MGCFIGDRFGRGGAAREGEMAEFCQHFDDDDDDNDVEEEAIGERGTQRRDPGGGRSKDDRVLQQRRHRNLHPHRHEYGSNFISFHLISVRFPFQMHFSLDFIFISFGFIYSIYSVVIFLTFDIISNLSIIDC